MEKIYINNVLMSKAIINFIFFLCCLSVFLSPTALSWAQADPSYLRSSASKESTLHSGTKIKSQFHIGIMTGSGIQGFEEFRGAQELIKLYGEADSGGMIRHIIFPDKFMDEIEITIDRIVQLAEDPLMKLIVISQAVPGTAEAFRRIKEKRPDILCLAGESQEDIDLISSAADLVVNADFISRGYLIPYAAKELGAKTFVHISFPRHMIDESMARRRAIMEQACIDLGLKFVYENVPDPIGSIGVDGARQFIIDNFPQWFKLYGPDTAFFCTNDALTQPVISQVIKYGGYFIEADLPSPLLGYPEALGLDIEGMPLEWTSILAKVEDGLIKAGAGGRMGTWTYSFGFVQTVAVVEFGKQVVEGQASITDTKKLLECFSRHSPKARWNGNFYTNAETNKKIDNYFLIYQDTYIFGKGYLGVVDVTVPAKFMGITSKPGKQETPPFHIGIVTGSEKQGGDDHMAALEMVKLYGDAAEGGMVKLAIYKDKFIEERENTIQTMVALADDPLMKLIVVNQAVPGTSEAFRRIKKKRPEILCLAGEAHENPDEIAATADLVVTSDFISRGYLIPHTAKELGAKTLVHVSFPRHMSYESILRRCIIMEQACFDLGLNFAMEEAPDPTGPVGINGARNFIMEQFPIWIKKYAKDTAFFCTNDAHSAPLIRQIVAHGGYFIEADLPSLLLGYPEAFGLNLKDVYMKWQNILQEVEGAAVKAGAAGRLGAWIYPLGFCQTAGMTEFGKRVVEGKAKLTDTKILLESYGKFSPGSRWNGSYYMDALTAKPIRNYFLIYQDTYILGNGYVGATSIDIPEKYLLMGKDNK